VNQGEGAGVAVGPAIELREGEYDAVHLDLDTDWILFRYPHFQGPKPHYKAWQPFFEGDLEAREAIQRRCCAEDGDPEVVRWVRGVLANYTKLCYEHFTPRRPVLVATSLGKDPRLPHTDWVLEAFVRSNAGLDLVVGRSSRPEVTLNAAAEFRYLERAGTLLWFTGSTYSALARDRVLARGGTVVPISF